MIQYSIEDLRLLAAYSYITAPVIHFKGKWFNGTHMISELSKHHTKILLSEFAINITDTEIIEFLKEYNASYPNQHYYIKVVEAVTFPIRTDCGVLINCYFKDTFDYVSFHDFEVSDNGEDLVMLTQYDEEVSLSIHSNYPLVCSLANRYSKVKVLLDEFMVNDTMRKIAGVDTLKLDNSNMLYANAFTDNDLDRSLLKYRVVTSLGVVCIGLHNDRVARFVAEQSCDIVRNDGKCLQRKISYNSNILMITAMYFHSLEVIGDKIKIWVVCNFRLNDGELFVGRLPLKYAKITSSTLDFYFQINTKQGSITVDYELVKHLDSTFTLDEVFDVYPDYADVLKDKFLAKIRGGFL